MFLEIDYHHFCSFLIIIFLLLVFSRYFFVNDFVYIPRKKKHNWKSVKLLQRTCFCSVCEMMISSNGLFCDNCGICSDQNCIKQADKLLKCKDKYSQEPSILHHWVKGNLPLNCECIVCRKDIDYLIEPGLYGYRCCWCQRTVHSQCFVKFLSDQPPDQQCDFGLLKDFIISPSSVIIAKSRRSRNMYLSEINKINIEQTWQPLLVIANVKSGSNTACEVLSAFSLILHPCQVFELGSKGPEAAIKLIQKIAPYKCRILVAGGDGTIGWVLNTLFENKIQPFPEVCILPIGTGNDLSRVLGWGSEEPSNFNPIEFITKIKNSTCIDLDRWQLGINRLPKLISLQWKPNRFLFMYNYFSIGVDAKVTYNFHKVRESPFYVFSNRIINKMLYLCFGSHQVFQPDCVGLENDIELYLDGIKINLPELQSIVILNIDSWGAGVKLCELSKSNKDNVDTVHSVSDGILEVFGIISSFHIAQLQVGLTKPIRLGQAKNIKIKIFKTCPVQADGEPWMQSPCEINIEFNDKAKMLKYS